MEIVPFDEGTIPLCNDQLPAELVLNEWEATCDVVCEADPTQCFGYT